MTWKKLEEINKVSPVPPNMDDGVTVAAGGLYGYAVDLDQQAGKDYEMCSVAQQQKTQSIGGQSLTSLSMVEFVM